MRGRSTVIRLSRRRVLEIGVGAAVLSVAGASTRVALAAGRTPVGLRDPALRSMTAEVTTIEGQTLVATTATGETVSAPMFGFPHGIAPRVGDLVSIVSGPQSTQGAQLADAPACLPTDETDQLVALRSGAVGRQAVPLCRWTTGVPAIAADGRLSIDGASLQESPAIRAAAVQQQSLAVCTMDSTLGDLQVLATRPVVG